MSQAHRTSTGGLTIRSLVDWSTPILAIPDRRVERQEEGKGEEGGEESGGGGGPPPPPPDLESVGFAKPVRIFNKDSPLRALSFKGTKVAN